MPNTAEPAPRAKARVPESVIVGRRDTQENGPTTDKSQAIIPGAAALAYAAAGLPVFPCEPRGKRPAVAGGLHSATTEADTIRCWRRRPDLNVAIPTGAESGFWVLDIDGAEGVASLQALTAQHGPLPRTRTVRTGGGGLHFWFRYSTRVSSAAGRIARGIDTRGAGGYVVVPPSIHSSGRTYQWGGDVDDVADAPDWLLHLTHERPSISERALALTRCPTGRSGAYGTAALEGEIAGLASTPGGMRNHTLNTVAFRLFQLVAGGELDGDQVVKRLIDACHRNGLVQDDGLRSVMATIRSGSRAGLQHPRARRERGAA